ncbi:MAG TPA: S-methyl-5-thioribose-1-phosphate isomerase [Longimicrobiales bacterium]
MTYPQAVRWSADGRAVELIDQRVLPEREVVLRLDTAEQVAAAIRGMAVRGAPAIGIAAAMGIALEMSRHASLAGPAFRRHLDATCDLLQATRPTAVNLPWAIERMRRVAALHASASTGEIACKLYGEATAILEEDRAMCRAIGEHAQSLLPDNARVLTHCNAGALATGGMGTALAPLYVAHERGRNLKVYADETRPLLQGSRLTVWELQRAGIDVTLIADVVAGSLMKQGAIDLVIVGADRIAANGDVANKIGTYSLAVLAKHHGIPFYVAAPGSTVDANTATGADIVIEERDADEVRRGFGTLTAPADANVYAPAFDVTPAELITAVITDQGVRPRKRGEA